MFSQQPLTKLGIQNLNRRTAIALLMALVSIILISLLPADLSSAGKITLGVWMLAIIGWTLTPLNDTFVALAAAIVLMLSATFATANFFASLGNSTVWLMIGAAIVGTALNESGLPARFTLTVTRYARTVSQLFYLLTALLLLSALIIPSVSIRTTLMIPIYALIITVFRDQRINRALALMLPINLMLTSIASLFGDGANLVINDTLGQLTGRPFSFFGWAMMALPFAAISAFGTTRIILGRLLDDSQRRLPVDTASFTSPTEPGTLSWRERYMLAITLLLLLLWLTEPWHGLDSALIALLGAMAVSIPVVGMVKFEQAAANVSWNVIAFVGATLFLSDALVESGAAAWLVNKLLAGTGVIEFSSQLALLAGVAVITLASHLLITSRSTRGAVIAPAVVLLAYSTGLDPQTLALVTAAGVGYSITLFISARVMLSFQRPAGSEEPLFTGFDLVRLSGILAPFHAFLIVLFGLFYWPLMGDGQVTDPAQAQERLREAPITTGRPGLLQGRAVVPVEVLNQAGIYQVGGQFQVEPVSPPPTPVLPTETLTPSPVPSPSPAATDTPGLIVTPTLTATPELTATLALTVTPALTITPVLTTTPELTATLALTATPPLTATFEPATPILTATPELTATPPFLTVTPELTATLPPVDSAPPILDPPLEPPTPEPAAPAQEPPPAGEEPVLPPETEEEAGEEGGNTEEQVSDENSQGD